MTSDGEKCYEYNEANQLKTVRNCNNNKLIADYLYDHTGKRIIKKEYTNGVLKRTVYSPDDGFEKVKLASNSAIQNTTYYMANDEVVARKNPDNSKTYYHGDHLGSNAVLTNQSGTVVEKTSYEPFGEVKSGGANSKFQYTGQEMDEETGLNYYDARYYNPHIQRFIQPDGFIQDVYDPQALNRYAYVRNNPLRYTDPSGHFWTALIGLVSRIAMSPVGRTVIRAVASSPIVKPIVERVASNPSVAAFIQRSQPVVNAARPVVNVVNNVTSNPTAYTPTVPGQINNVASFVTKNPSFIPNTIKKLHGNDLRSIATTWGYTLRDKAGNIVKFGQSIDPSKRYAEKWLDINGLRMVKETSGSKFDMRVWEHEQIGQYIFKYGDSPLMNDISRSVNVFR